MAPRPPPLDPFRERPVRPCRSCSSYRWQVSAGGGGGEGRGGGGGRPHRRANAKWKYSVGSRFDSPRRAAFKKALFKKNPANPTPPRRGRRALKASSAIPVSGCPPRPRPTPRGPPAGRAPSPAAGPPPPGPLPPPRRPPGGAPPPPPPPAAAGGPAAAPGGGGVVGPGSRRAGARAGGRAPLLLHLLPQRRLVPLAPSRPLTQPPAEGGSPPPSQSGNREESWGEGSRIGGVSHR